MIKIEPHGLWHWCTVWPDGLGGRLKGLWAPVCRMHDIMGALSELEYGEEVECDGEIFSWPRLGFDEPPTQQWQDWWLLSAISAIGKYLQGLSAEERKQVKDNAEVMYYGLRSFGVFYRSIL